MDYFFRKCVLIYTIRQEMGGQADRGIWRGWCRRLVLGIFDYQLQRRGGFGRGQVLENFASLFRRVKISIGFAPPSYWVYFFRVPSFLLVRSISIITVVWNFHLHLYHWEG